MHIIDSLNERGITAPVLLRVPILFLTALTRSMLCSPAIEEQGYKNRYQGVFPVKVNQQAQVIDRIVAYGRSHDFGLELGPKPNF